MKMQGHRSRSRMERVSAGAPLLFWLDSFGYMPHPLSIHHYMQDMHTTLLPAPLLLLWNVKDKRNLSVDSILKKTHDLVDQKKIEKITWKPPTKMRNYCSKYIHSTYTTVYIHNDSFPIKSAFLPPFRFRKRNLSDFCLIFTTDGEYVLSIYLLIAIFSDWKHRWRNTIYIQEIEIRSYVISLGDDDFIFSAQQIFVTYLRNTKKENFKNVMFLE